MSKIYVNDIGLEISIDCKTTVSGSSNRTLEVKKSDGTTVSWSAGTSGDDNLTYTTVAGDLDIAGVYTLQAKCTIGGWIGKGASVKFTIYKAFS